MRYITSALLLCSPVLFIGCGGESSTPHYSNVTVAVSDAPVDTASEVVIAFHQIELVQEDDSVFIDISSENGAKDYAQVDLIQYQNTDTFVLVEDQQVPIGTYQNVILHISPDAGLNYVVDDTLGQLPLKQPSNKLRLGELVIEGSDESYVIEFDLRQALVMRGNSNNNNGYILKPHGVTIINNDISSSLAGAVEPNLLLGNECNVDGLGFVYLYQGHQLDSSLFVDLFDGDIVQNNPVPQGSIAPHASVAVNEQNEYAFGFLEPGEYTVALSCDASGDDSEQYDGLSIPLPVNQVFEVSLTDGQLSVINFSSIP